MKNRFREYRQRLVQNQARKPGLGTVTNADPYRDERGRFSTARDATEEAIRATLATRWGQAQFPNRIDGLSQGSQEAGSEFSHGTTAAIHHSLNEAHDLEAREAAPNSLERKRHLGAARLHIQAADAHLRAGDRLHDLATHHIQVYANPGFDLTDSDQRAIYADWLEDRGHTAASHHLRVYSS